jgi:imidazolonepropionase-like amidohydrolase
MQGAYADMLLVDGNPIDDLSVLTNPESLRLIMKGGVVYKNTLGDERPRIQSPHRLTHTEI